MRRWEEEEYYRRIAEEERFWEEEHRRRFEVEFYEGWGPGRMGPPRGPPGPMGPRPLMEGVGDMGPVRRSVEYLSRCIVTEMKIDMKALLLHAISCHLVAKH